MPYCASASCNNSTNKGFRLFAFPKDLVKREKWRKNCGRGDNWQPSDNHKICEVHFDESQFETRALTHSGKRKLKPCAIPTLFSHSDNVAESQKHKKNIKTPNLTRKRFTRASKLKNQSLQEDDEGENDSPVSRGDDCCQRLKDAATSTDDLEANAAEAETNIYSIKMERLLNKVIAQCTTIRQLRRKLLKAKKQSSMQSSNINKVFTQDQLKALNYSTKGRFEWSDETIKRSVQMRLACGPKGYNYLLSLGYPFPSYRTLCSRAESPKQPQVLEFRLENLEMAEPVLVNEKTDLSAQQNVYEIDLHVETDLPYEIN